MPTATTPLAPEEPASALSTRTQPEGPLWLWQGGAAHERQVAAHRPRRRRVAGSQREAGARRGRGRGRGRGARGAQHQDEAARPARAAAPVPITTSPLAPVAAELKSETSPESAPLLEAEATVMAPLEAPVPEVMLTAPS